ncbi:MAG: hypothetical protein FWE03_02995 [Firmicutes bacterium]|nr:hypothetical protein [Bacillota bacterium]
MKFKLEDYLFNRIVPIFDGWIIKKDIKDIYAISFFVYSNECNNWNGINNISEFSINYLANKHFKNEAATSKEDWDILSSCCQGNLEMQIIQPNGESETGKIIHTKNTEGIKFLFEWYNENKIVNIGHEDYNNCYDDKNYYIGKGPKGYYELLMAVSNVARRIQQERIIPEKFGKTIPIIIHDLEMSAWYIKNAIENANPNGEAQVFLEAINNKFIR